MSFKYTTAIKKIRAMKARKKIVQGSTSSGKTYGIIPILIDKAAKTPKLKITVVAETIPAVKDGAVDIFKAVMESTGRWREAGWKGNPMQYKFANGSVIQFKAFDTEGKAKASGKRDILFINEANHIDFKIADALMIRSKEVFLDFNPDNEFWAHSEVLPEPNSELLILTYEHNEALPPETLEDLMIKRSKAFNDPFLPVDELFSDGNIKHAYWSNWWRVYGLGMPGRLQGLVFENWEEVQEIPEGARLEGYGIDFGYAESPFAMVGVYKYDGFYYFDEVVYETGLTNPRSVIRAEENGADIRVCSYCDYAEPKSIQELQDYGMNAEPCASKQDIREYSIKKLQGDKFYVRGANLVQNFQTYKWATDKTGASTGKPEKKNDHGPDAIYYFVGTDDKYSGSY